MNSIRRYTSINVPFGANTQANSSIFFPQQSLLQDVTGKEPVYIRSIDVFSTANLSGVPQQPGVAIAAPADIANTTLTLSMAANLEIRWLPLTRINQFIPNAAAYSGAVQFPFLLADMRTIDWTQSYLQTINASPTVAAHAFVFGISYLYQSDLNQLQQNGFLPDFDRV